MTYFILLSLTTVSAVLQLVKRDDWNASSCLSHARPTQNSVDHSHETRTLHRRL